MSTIFLRSKDQGFSVDVSRRVATGQLRTSTQLIYESKWAKFALWCQQRDIDPEQAPVSSACDFLLHLFEHENLAPSSIDGYRSAINSVWHTAGRSLTESYHVTQLLRSFRADRPRSTVVFPKWDLNLVLRVLSRPPFHPVEEASPFCRSAKTAFLLLLASARRRGDIHAIDPKRVTFTSSAAILEPSPRYLPKIRAAAEGEARYAPIVIKALTTITQDPSELSLCPVLALRAYDAYATRKSPN